ncbi:MAG: hypothetical protein QGF09_03640 [Rhodospirillales bacterium]|nr:hypothetical protein [Rhodospirillales bacterium]
MEYAIDLREASQVFMPGHRLVMELRGQDTPTEDPIWYHLCNPPNPSHTIPYGGDQGSYLLAPVIP